MSRNTRILIIVLPILGILVGLGSTVVGPLSHHSITITRDDATTTTTEYVSLVVSKAECPKDAGFCAEWPVDESDKKVYSAVHPARDGYPENTQYFTQVFPGDDDVMYTVAVYPNSVELQQKFESIYKDSDCQPSPTRKPAVGICTSVFNQSGLESVRVEMLIGSADKLYVVSASSMTTSRPADTDAFLNSFQLKDN